MPFLSDSELDALLEQLPALAGRPRRLEELSGGLTNRNVKITTPTGAYVARCSVNAQNLLGIDRDNEFYNSRAAAEAGVGAPVIDYRPDLGILLVGFLEGVTLTNADLQRPGVLARVATGVRGLHAGPRFRDRFDMFERQPAYLKVVQDNGFRLPRDYVDFAPAFAEIRRVLEATDRTTVPCNNDLLAGNFVDNGERVWLIDYEYSGNNDPFFEIGNVWSEAAGTPDDLDRLVSAYVGHPSTSLTARARLWGLMSKYGWMLWASIQEGTSDLDFDFWSWGLEKYDRAVAEFDGPDLGRLLEEVRRSD